MSYSKLITSGLALAALALTACGQADAQGPAGDATPTQSVGAGLRDAATLAVFVDLPADAVLTSPMKISGSADSRFFNEGVFPIRLIGADGCVLGEAPAMPTGDWMVEGQVGFEATLSFRATPGTSAVLVFEQDIAGENPLPPLDVRMLVKVAGRIDPQGADPDPADCAVAE